MDAAPSAHAIADTLSSAHPGYPARCHPRCVSPRRAADEAPEHSLRQTASESVEPNTFSDTELIARSTHMPMNTGNLAQTGMAVRRMLFDVLDRSYGDHVTSFSIDFRSPAWLAPLPVRSTGVNPNM